jgi:hypothetical protein
MKLEKENTVCFMGGGGKLKKMLKLVFLFIPKICLQNFFLQ